MSLPPKLNIPSLKLHNGYEMPLVALGTYGTENDTDNFIKAIKYAIKIGYRHIDTAWLYNNEEAVGQAIREAIAESNGELKREDLFVVSKVWNTFHSRDLVKQIFNKTLTDLGLDYLDLYLLHWPMGFKEGYDPLPADENGKRLYSNVHYLETYKAMEELVKEGKVRSIGISNFNLAQTQDVLKNCEIKPVNNQFEINPYIQCEKVVDFCQKNGIVVSGFCPVGGGQETPTLPGLKPLLKNDTILKLAEKYKKTPAQICLRWAVQKNIIVLPKSVKYERLYENADLFNFTLSEEDMNELRGLNKNYRVYGNDDLKDHPFYPFAEVW